MRNKLYKCISSFIKVLLIGGLITISLVRTAFGEENILDVAPSKGNIKVEGVQDYTNEEFKEFPVRITVFSASWCTYCKELKYQLPEIIYGKYKNKDVAIRIWEIDSEEVLTYFDKFAEKNNVPNTLKGQIPFIFINEEYPYLGYSKELAVKITEDIQSILSGQEPKYKGNIKPQSFQSKDDNIYWNKNKMSYIFGGIFDGLNFLLISVFMIVSLYFINKNGYNLYMSIFLYFTSIIIFNILTLTNTLNLLLCLSYVKTIRIGLYIVLAICIFEALVQVLRGNLKGFAKIRNRFTSKIIYGFVFALGFIATNSQIHNQDIYYSVIYNSTNSNFSILTAVINSLLYSLGLILVNSVYILVIDILKVIFKNKNKKKYLNK